MHFCTLVISKPDENLEDVMAPYDESLECESEIEITRDDILQSSMAATTQSFAEYKLFNEDILQYFQNKRSTYTSLSDIPEKEIESHREFVTRNFNTACKREHLTQDQLFDVIKEEEYCGCEFDDDGNLVSSYNPDGYWDWWVVGGRWENSLRTKLGTNVNEARVCDLDLDNLGKMPDEEEKKYRKFWKFYVEGDTSVAESEEEARELQHMSWRKPEDLKKEYKTEDKYIEHLNTFSCYAILTEEDGWMQEDWSPAKNWHDYIINTLKDADPKDIVTIVDCHI